MHSACIKPPFICASHLPAHRRRGIAVKPSHKTSGPHHLSCIWSALCASLFKYETICTFKAQLAYLIFISVFIGSYSYTSRMQMDVPKKSVQVHTCRHISSMNCAKRITINYWISNHIPYCNTMRPTVPEIQEEDMHVRTCRCKPHMICEKCIAR